MQYGLRTIFQFYFNLSLAILQPDVTYSVYYISVASSTW